MTGATDLARALWLFAKCACTAVAADRLDPDRAWR